MSHLQPIPPTWPRPDPRKPHTLASRMDPADLSDLYNRRVTTRELAKKYGTTEKWMSQTFSGKVRVAKASQRKAARNAFREFHAQQVVAGQVNIYQAAEAAYTSYSTMRRVVLRLLKRERLT